MAATSKSAVDGTYELFVPAGGYRIVFEDRSGTYASAFYAGAESFDGSTVIELGPGGTLDSIDAAMQRGGRITGTVRDAGTGAALASIVVASYNASGTVRAFTPAATDGTYTLIVPPGAYKVGAYDTSLTYAAQFHSGQPAFAYGAATGVPAGATVAPIDFALRRGGHVSGTVTDRASAAPLGGITVAAYDPTGSIVSRRRISRMRLHSTKHRQ